MKSLYLILSIVWLSFSMIKAQNLSTYEEDELYLVVEEMPRFPGCEEKPKDERASCAQQKMLNFVYENLKYPSSAKKNSIEGTVVAQFIVTKEGRIDDVVIIRSIQDACDKEVVRVLEKMNSLPSKWIPGSQGGKAVHVKYTFPVKFKLARSRRS